MSSTLKSPSNLSAEAFVVFSKVVEGSQTYNYLNVQYILYILYIECFGVVRGFWNQEFASTKTPLINATSRDLRGRSAQLRQRPLRLQRPSCHLGPAKAAAQADFSAWRLQQKIGEVVVVFGWWCYLCGITLVVGYKIYSSINIG